MQSRTTIPSDDVAASPTTTNGSGGARSDALPLAPSRRVRSRVPQVVLAALLIVGGGLGAVLLFNQYNQRTPAVIVTAEVPHGAQLGRDQLAITEVAVDGDVRTLGSIDEAVGRFAANDLSPGELLSPADVATDEQLVTAGESVVGLLLEPGAYPTTRLVAGDRVDVFAADGQGELLAADLVVFDVVASSSDGRTLLVSVVVDDGQAARLFAADGQGGTRLALRGRT